MLQEQHKLIDGKLLSQKLLEQIRVQIRQNTLARPPALAVVLVGDNPASQVYVRNKRHACAQVGITSQQILLDDDTTQQQLLELIHKLNCDDSVDGILVQLPLPRHIDSNLVINNIASYKDVDGFHRYNIGSLAINDARLCPCTPHGVMYMLDSINISYLGKHAVIIGASNIVGRPMALELLNRKATVTVCNSKTHNLPQLSATADILIVAVGQPKLVGAAWVKPHSVVIDVGINRMSDGGLCGDVDLAQVIDKVDYISPVPGGVGPMTVAMLMNNTLQCYVQRTEDGRQRTE